MLVHKAYRFRLDPNVQQKVLITKTIGCSRFVFNHFLSAWNKTYEETGKGLTSNTCAAQLTLLKREKDNAWFREVDSIALQSSLKCLDDAYRRFLKKQSHRPRFKSKKNKVKGSVRQDSERNHQAQSVRQIFCLHSHRNRGTGLGKDRFSLWDRFGHQALRQSIRSYRARKPQELQEI